MDDLLKAILPLTFLALWALTSLFNRETRPAPNRPQGLGPRPGGGGPGGGIPLGTRPGERPAPPSARDPNLRWGDAGGMAANRGAGRPGVPADSEILIIRSEASRAAGPPLPRPGAGTVRKTTRSKPPVQKRPESPPARPLSGPGGMSLPQGLTKPLDVAPIVVGQPLLGTAQPSAAIPSASATTPPARPGMAPIGANLRRLVGSREALRDAFVLNEVLQPPVSMRPSRRPF